MSGSTFIKNTRIEISLTWQNAVDLDLLAIYETKNQEFGLIYYANQGNLDEFPYIKLGEDEGTNEEDGDYEENLSILKIDSNIKYIWICTWNYQKVLNGDIDDMINHEIKTEIVIPMTSQHKRVTIPFSVDQELYNIYDSNFAVLCLLDCHQFNSQEFQIKNLSILHKLTKLDSTEMVSFLKKYVEE